MGKEVFLKVSNIEKYYGKKEMLQRQLMILVLLFQKVSLLE